MKRTRAAARATLSEQALSGLAAKLLPWLKRNSGAEVLFVLRSTAMRSSRDLMTTP